MITYICLIAAEIYQVCISDVCIPTTLEHVRFLISMGILELTFEIAGVLAVYKRKVNK